MRGRGRFTATADSPCFLIEIDHIDFSSSTEADRAMLIDAMNSLKDALNEAIPPAGQNRKKPG